MKKLLLIPIAIIAILIVGKFGLEYRYKQKLDEGLAKSAGFVDASYDKLFIDLQGGVNIKNFRFSDRTGQFMSGSFENMRLFSSDRTMLIKGFDSIQDGELPKILEMKFDGLLVDLSKIQQVNEARECRYIEEPTSLDSKLLATKPTNFSIRAENVDQNLFKMVFFSATPSVSRMNGEFIMEKAIAKSPLAAATNKNKLPLKSLQISNKFDPSYTDKYIAYCAEKLNISADDYVNNIIGGDKFYSALKFAPTNELKNAVKRHYTGENELTIKSKPKSTVKNLNQLSLFKPKQIISALNLVVIEDDKPLNELVKSEAQVKLENLAKEAAKKDAAPSETEATVQARKPKPKFYGKRKFSFEVINKNEARNYIGKDVKIYRKKRLIKGILLSATRSSVKVKSSKHGGSTTMDLNLNEISKFEVKQFKPIN